ncbi:MAG: GntR family transcriptional regulator, partial [Verrucomicrobiota bacterium]
MLMKTASQSLTEQLCTRFAERIRTRLLAPGARLPSVRQCAQQQGVSPSTVVAAYDQLLAQGLVEARKNRGFYVRELAVALDNTAQSATTFIAQPVARGGFQAHHVPVNATALIRGMFHGSSDKPQPGMGVFPPDWLDTTFMPAAVRKVSSNRALRTFSLQYGEPAGDSGLRQSLSQKLVTHNVHATPAQIVYTATANTFSHGQLLLDSAHNGSFLTVVGNGTTFTQDDIDNNRLRYVHDGSEPAYGADQTLSYSVSGGGTTTMFATLLDERIMASGPACCAVPCACHPVIDVYAPCAETLPWKRFADGYDDVDVLAAALPTPVLLMAG